MTEEQNTQVATELEHLKKKYKRCKEFNKLIKKELKQVYKEKDELAVRVTTLQEEKQEKETTISKISKQLEKAKIKISELETEVTQTAEKFKSQISKLTDDLTSFKSKKNVSQDSKQPESRPTIRSVFKHQSDGQFHYDSPIKWINSSKILSTFGDFNSAESIISSTDSENCVRIIQSDGYTTSSLLRPDGNIAFASNSGEVRLFDQDLGKLRSRRIHKQAITAFCNGPGDSLITCSRDGTVKQTEINSDFISLSFKGTAKVTNCVDYSNNLIATGSEDNVIRIYESGLGEEQEDPVCEASHSGPITQVSFSRDLLATSSRDGTTRIWNEEIENIQSLFHTAGVKTHQWAPENSALSGKIATASDCYTRIWDVDRGRVLFRHMNSFPIKSIDFSQDAKTLATCDEKGVRIFSTSSTESISRVTCGKVSCVKFNPDGTYLAVGNSDGTVRVIDLRQPKN